MSVDTTVEGLHESGSEEAENSDNQGLPGSPLEPPRAELSRRGFLGLAVAAGTLAAILGLRHQISSADDQLAEGAAKFKSEATPPVFPTLPPEIQELVMNNPDLQAWRTGIISEKPYITISGWKENGRNVNQKAVVHAEGPLAVQSVPDMNSAAVPDWQFLDGQQVEYVCAFGISYNGDITDQDTWIVVSSIDNPQKIGFLPVAIDKSRVPQGSSLNPMVSAYTPVSLISNENQPGEKYQKQWE